MRTTSTKVALTALGTLVGVAGWGQSSVPSDLRLVAIVGAKIEVGNGQVIEKGTLVIRGGVIEAVGADVATPKGAEVVDGAGLTLYPGFIDAYNRKPVKLPTPPADTDAPAPLSEYASASMRTGNKKGMHPEWEARSFLDLGEDAVKPYRAAGFTTLGVVPSGGYVAGVGTLVNLSGKPARESVVLPRTAMAITFEGAGDWSHYPGSLLGIHAFLRQTFLDTQWFAAQKFAYANGGADRAPSDLTLESLQPLLARELGATFEVSTPAEIDRALSLADEFNLKTTLVGALQGYRRTSEIKAKGASVIVSLNLGEEPKKQEEKKEGNEPEQRRNERIRKYGETVANLDEIRKSGIPFALTTNGSKDPAAFMKSLRAVVKGGFPRSEALAALTRYPAQLYGLESRLGTLEVGKVADVVLMKGDFLDESAKVTALYIDGYKIDLKEGDK